MRYFFLVPFLLICFLLSSCSAATDVKVDMHADGSGQIAVRLTLDDEAQRAAPNLVAQLHASDLKSSGWTIGEPTATNKSDKTIEIAHQFSNPAEANGYLQQLSAQSHAFKDMHIDYKRSMFSVDSKFSGTVDLSRGVETFGDSELASVTGKPLGFDVQSAINANGGEPNALFPIRVQVNLPGTVEHVSPVETNTAAGSESSDEEGNGWNLGYGTVTPLAKSSHGQDVPTVVMIIFGLVFLLLAVVFAGFWKTESHIPRRVGRHGISKD